MPSAKQGSCGYLFKVFWYDLTRGMNPKSTECEADALPTSPSRRLKWLADSERERKTANTYSFTFYPTLLVRFKIISLSNQKK